MTTTRCKLFTDTVLNNLLDAQKIWHPPKGRCQRADSVEPLHFTSFGAVG